MNFKRIKEWFFRDILEIIQIISKGQQIQASLNVDTHNTITNVIEVQKKMRDLVGAEIERLNIQIQIQTGLIERIEALEENYELKADRDLEDMDA